MEKKLENKKINTHYNLVIAFFRSLSSTLLDKFNSAPMKSATTMPLRKGE
jgi:hypothetical protein